MAKSTKSPKSSPARLSLTTTHKPYEGFPLSAHPSGRWCKKIRGKLHYFGKLADPQAALALFNREWPYLSEGRMPPPFDTGEGCTLALLCNAFLGAKDAKRQTGELSARSFQNYFRTCELLIQRFGRDRRVDDLRPDDFEALRKFLAKTRGPVALRNEINCCRVVFKFAFDQRLIEKPVHFGQSFDRPSAKTLRKARHDAGLRMFEADECRRILEAADVQLKAMTLLALNSGFGNTDCATLPQSALDLAGGWINFPRPKTEIQRRVPLWPETVEALRKAIAERPKAKNPDDEGLVFLTQRGARWVRVRDKKNAIGSRAITAIDALTQRFRKLLDELGINGHRGFYAGRHTFQTVAGESKDQVAVDSIMGHVDPSMGAVYRERISDERLRAVVEVVRVWLFTDSKTAVR